jgi:uncharacterized membrane protein HdeD (DUF308 family)
MRQTLGVSDAIRGFSETWVTPLLRRWWMVAGLGVVMVVVGVLLLLNPFEAVKTLAVLVAIGLALAAADELAQAERHQVAWPSYALGAIWLATAVFAIVWPGVTLWALAVVVGVGLIVGGLAEVVFVGRYRRVLPMWGVWLLDGALAVVVGVFALAWPEATILALAILLGIRVLLRGLATLTFGLALRRLNLMTSPHVPT